MKNKEKLSFAVMIKKSGKPFVTIKTTDGQFDYSFYIISWLTNFIYVPQECAEGMLADLRSEGKLNEKRLNLLVSCLLERLVCYGYKKYGLTKKDEQTLLSFMKEAECNENVIDLCKTKIKALNNSSSVQREKMHNLFTFNPDLMEDILKGSDSYAVVDVTENALVNLEDIAFFHNLPFEKKIAHFISDPYDLQEVLEFYNSGCKKSELFVFVKTLLEDNGSERVKVHKGRLIDNLKCVFYNSKKGKHKELSLLKPVPVSGHDELYTYFEKAGLVAPGRGIYFDVENEGTEIEFYIDNV